MLTSTWDEEIHDECLSFMLEDVYQIVTLHDPAGGRWDVDGEEVDASSLALDAVLEMSG